MSTTPTTPQALANVPDPAGAVKVDAWFDADIPLGRYFVGASWVVELNNRDNDIMVRVDGFQYSDGRILREITTQIDDYEGLDPLTVEQARQLAAALTAAADEAEKMNSYDSEITD